MTQLSDIQSPITSSHTRSAYLLALAMALVVGSALGFEHIGGYIPCALCLEQRVPYYIGVPLMLLAGLNATTSGPAFVTRGLLLTGGLLMSWGAALGIFHSGVEWHFWAGPVTCGGGAGGVTTDAGNLLSDLNSKKPPSCDAAALRIFGLSLAGWNVLASVALAHFAYRSAFRRNSP